MQVNEQQWTEVITPRTNLFDLKLKELWRYRDLILLFIKRDFASQYKQTVLGPVWHLIQPILTTAMFFVLFNRIAKIPTDNLPPAIFYMSGITIWNYFSACFTGTSSTFVSNAGIFGKVYFPRLVLPLSLVCSNIIRFGIQMLLLIAAMIFYYIKGDYTFNLGIHTLLMPVVLLIMGLFGLGTGIIISSLTTKYRDLTVLISFGVQLLMYLTPVAYSLSYVEKSSYRLLIKANPLTSLIETFRYSVLGRGTFDLPLFVYSCVCALLAMLIGMLLFNRVEKSFMDTV